MAAAESARRVWRSGPVLVDRLRIADASVMPDIPFANTHIPTLMVAERLAERIRGQNARR